ncbi:CoA transferase [bacterium]|nr:MAG: CoA transferase [bacterium]MCL4230035.1 CoA transferase [Dehalococcoidia bacterium]
MTSPLAGIRILDFTRYQQGPFATVMLGDMGAEVIKIEETTIGDYGRRVWRERDGFSAFWESLNRGKKSVCIDLRTDAGRELALKLGETSDVVMENFRPGTMEGWGLGYDDFRARNPRIIYGQATGWGTKGPMAGLPSFDQIAQAFSGYAQQCGGGIGTRPEVPFPGVADQTGAMNFAFGILTALFVRERTGVGQKVDVSLLGTQLALQAPALLHALHFGQERAREFRASPTTGQYECADGRWVMIVGIDQKFWPRIANALQVPHLIEDPRFATGHPRYVNKDELESLLEQAFRACPSAYWLDRLREHDVPASLVRNYAEVAGDEQIAMNGYIVEQENARFGPQKVVGLHVQLSETPGEVGAPAPGLGEHTFSILRSAGIDDRRLAELAEAGVIRGS